MAFRARTFKVNFRCYVDPEVYNGFSIALCVQGKLPTDNPIQQIYIKPPYNASCWYEYTFYDFFLDDQKVYDVFVQAIAYNRDSFWRSVGGIEIPDDGIGTIGDKSTSGPPDNVQGFSYQIVETGVILSWNPIYNIDLSHFEIRSGVSWESTIDNVIYNGKNTSHMLPMLQSGSYSLWIKSFDVDKKECLLASQVAFVIQKPSAPAVTTKVVGEKIEISWSQPSSTFPITEYELKHNGVSLGKLKSTIYSVSNPVAGVHTFAVSAINAVGEQGNEGSSQITIVAPGAVSVFPQVIDNNVLLRWTAPVTGSLPVLEYEVRRGDTFASATPLGRISSLFTVIFESKAADYKYWVMAVDVAKNSGQESYCVASVSEPPDFVLHSEQYSAKNGTKSSVFKTAMETLLAPVNTVQTWAEHFTANGFTTPQQQIDAGYLYYMEPSVATSFYTETVDFGAQISSSKISISPEYRVLYGSVNVSCKIEASADNVTFVDYGNVFEAYGKGFRYVRYTLTFSQTGNKSLLEVDNILVRLSVKKKWDSGTVVCTASDYDAVAGKAGKRVEFETEFLDVASITTSLRAGGTGAYVIYDFKDVPSPTHFHILVYDKAGVRVDGTVSWEAKGV